MNVLVVALVSLGHFGLEFADGGISLLLPLVKEKLDISHAAVGSIMMLRIFGSSVFQPIFGFCMDLKPIPWFLPASVFVAAASVASLGLCPNYLIVLLAVFVGGLGGAAFHPISSKAIYYNSGPRPASGLAVFMVAGNMGYAMGPALMSFLLYIGGLGGTIYILGLGITTTILLILMMRGREIVMSDGTRPDETLKKSLREVASRSVILITVFSIMRCITHLGFITYIPFYFYEGGATVALTIFLIAGALGTLLGGTLADRLGSGVVIRGFSMLSIPSCLLFVYTEGVWALIFLAMAGLTLLATASVTTSLCQKLMPHGIGLASGLTMGFGYGVAGIGMVLVGYLADTFGVTVALWSVALATIPTLVMAFISTAPGLVQKHKGNLSEGT